MQQMLLILGFALVAGFLTSRRRFEDEHDGWDEINYRAAQQRDPLPFNHYPGSTGYWPYLPPGVQPPYQYDPRVIYDMETKRLENNFRNGFYAALICFIGIIGAYYYGKIDNPISPEKKITQSEQSIYSKK